MSKKHRVKRGVELEKITFVFCGSSLAPHPTHLAKSREPSVGPRRLDVYDRLINEPLFNGKTGTLAGRKIDAHVENMGNPQTNVLIQSAENAPEANVLNRMSPVAHCVSVRQQDKSRDLNGCRVVASVEQVLKMHAMIWISRDVEQSMNLCIADQVPGADRVFVKDV